MKLASAVIAQLQYESGRSVGKRWLAGLLGRLELEQRGEFYEAESVQVGVLQ